MMSTVSAVDEVSRAVDAWAISNPVPGVAWGLIVDAELVHAGSSGLARIVDAAPVTPATVFRIASMTKSFTAAAVLQLRDAGALRLDDPIADYVPELAHLELPTRDSPAPSIRHLLTMSAGLPTDDPWADRQLGLASDRFTAVLREGFTFQSAPGVRFEYANAGYAILGRVIANVSGVDYQTFVRSRLLGPLGLASTSFDASDLRDDRLAHGYVRRDDIWLEEPMAADGAFAAIGGIFSTVRDISRWTIELMDAFPARDDAEGGRVLERASRREMQQVQVIRRPALRWEHPSSRPSEEIQGYGYGLFITVDPTIGTIVGHPGGLPGFGSAMVWHPESRIGIVVLANARYAGPYAICLETLRALVVQAGRPRQIAILPQTVAARAAVERLIDRWDDTVAMETFAMNVDLDEPLDRRAGRVASVREQVGPLLLDQTSEPESDSPAGIAWWMLGSGGRVRVELSLSPERTPRVQRFEITFVPEPSPELRLIATRVTESLRQPAPAWPVEIELDPSIDGDELERDLRATAAIFGPLRVGPAIEGDGDSCAVFRLDGERGALLLEIALDATSGIVCRARIGPIRA